MSRELTKKQRIFVKEYLKTGNGKQSAMKAYDTTDDLTARSIASENLTKPNVKIALADRIDEDKLYNVLNEGLQADRISDDGSSIADYSVRHKYLDTGMKVKGLYAPDKHAIVTVDVTNDKLIALAEALNKANNKGI